MQTPAKLASLAAAVIAVAAVVLWQETERIHPAAPVAAGAPPATPEPEFTNADLATSGGGIAGEDSTAERSALNHAPTDSTPPGAEDPLAENEEIQVSILRARIIDVDARPLPGATLSSIYTDGRPRGEGNVAVADADGRIVLKLDDGSMRMWRGEVYDMRFAAVAQGCCTAFPLCRPVLHGDTDLGDIRLGPGGTILGMCVDPDGHPIEGALIYSGVGVVTEPMSELRLRGPDTRIPRTRTTTGADGRFELAGVQPGTPGDEATRLRIWAHRKHGLWTVSDSVMVMAGASVDVGRLVIEAVPDDLRISGIVLSSSGQPFTGARVDFNSVGNRQEGHVETGSDGRFVIVPKGEAAVEMVARDPSGGEGMSAPASSKAGELVELLLTEKRLLIVRVTDHGDRPLPGASVGVMLDGGASFFAGGGRPVPGADWEHTDAQGAVKIELPGATFSISASKTGYSAERTGSLEPAIAPGAVTLVLTKDPVLTGRVLLYGEPVEGARIAVGQRHEGTVTMTGSFPNRFWESGVSGVSSDSEGRFEAPVDPDATKLAVVARRDGLAAGEVSLDVEPGEGAEGIVIHMTRGGAVEGSVLPPSGREAAGLYVAASRGDGHPLSTIVDEEGRYRFEGLTPGDWRIEGRLDAPRTDRMSVAQRPEDGEFRWNAVVVDGETLELDVDMRRLGEVQFQGRLWIDGAPPPAGWTVTVVRPIHEDRDAEASAAELDPEGHFALTTRPGRVDLRLTGLLPGGATVEMLREVEISGPSFDWEGDLTTAQVEESLDGPTAKARFVRGRYDNGDRELTQVPVNGDGVLSCRVPVGKSSLQTPAAEAVFADAWNHVRFVQVR